MIVLKDVLSKQQCLGFIEWAESLNFTDSSSKPAWERGNNALLIFEDQKLSDSIWHKISSLLPTENSFGKVNGLNDYFRLYRYLPGMSEQFPEKTKHVRSPKETAVYTVIIFLNNPLEGGEILLADDVIITESGKALILENQNSILCSAIKKGIKYVLISDVVYRISQ